MADQHSIRTARQSVRASVTALALAASLLALGVGLSWRDVIHAAAPAATTTAAAPLPAMTTPVTSYAGVVDLVAPAVVTIRTEARLSRRTRGMPFAREFEEEGLGSGIVVRADGYILTNHHVVDRADRIAVELADKRVLPATVVGDDAPSDLAVVKIAATGLQALALADSDHARVGDVVLAVGNPLGVGQTVTSGIISAKGRTTFAANDSYQDFIQTDAPINQGNSGGALVNLQGQLLGINSQIVSPTGGNVGLGFAIPSNMARPVMDQLIAQGRVRRAKLGVTVQPVTADLASSLRLAEVRGALVNSVEPRSPGAQADLRPGDVILAVQGHLVTDGNDLRNAVSSSEPGSSITLQVMRDGQPRTLTARLTELP
jgi:Do/DeqQ family serine protease